MVTICIHNCDPNSCEEPNYQTCTSCDSNHEPDNARMRGERDDAQPRSRHLSPTPCGTSRSHLVPILRVAGELVVLNRCYLVGRQGRLQDTCVSHQQREPSDPIRTRVKDGAPAYKPDTHDSSKLYPIRSCQRRA
eukprot:scaffold2220_cov377-Prasinococcus_capsulatus_cf.AAC.9